MSEFKKIAEVSQEFIDGIQNLLFLNVQACVELPEKVSIIQQPVFDDEINFLITVSSKDVAKIVGQQGKIANALRVIAKAAAKGQFIAMLVVEEAKP